MIVLDENIPESQRQLLYSRRIRVRQIGHDFSHKGIQDEQIIPLLIRQRQPTFFTRDLGFYDRALCHARYCLICLAVGRYEVAAFVRRVLGHPEFDTHAKRLGTVVRASSAGLQLWRLHAEKEVLLKWET